MSDHMSKLDERLARVVDSHAGALAAAATNHSEPPNSCPSGDDCNEPPTCECCGCEYTMETGDEPTPFCDRCAHDVLEKQTAELASLRTTIATLTHRAEAAEAKVREYDSWVCWEECERLRNENAELRAGPGGHYLAALEQDDPVAWMNEMFDDCVRHAKADAEASATLWRERCNKAEARAAEATEGREKVGPYELLQHGGTWLGAARSWLQRHTRNGERVTWGSGDAIEHTFTVRDVEQLAAEAASAAMRPQPSEERLSASLKARWKAEQEAATLRAELRRLYFAVCRGQTRSDDHHAVAQAVIDEYVQTAEQCDRNDTLATRHEADEAHRQRLEQSRSICIEALRGVRATGSPDAQTWDVVADGIKAMRADRDAAIAANAALATIAKAHAVIGGRDTHGADGDAACIVDTVLDVMEASRDISRAEALAIDQRDAARFLAAGWRRLARHYQSCHLAGHACLRETHRRLGEVAADRDEWKRGHAAQVQCVGWHRDAIAEWRKARDEVRAQCSRMHRRAQEAERLLGLAMRVGYATCWPLRSERDHYRALAERMQKHASTAALLRSQIDDAHAETDRVRARAQRVVGHVRDLAEHECAYHDGCPAFGSRHGQCTGCKAREALAKWGEG